MFLGFANFYQQLIQGFSQIAASLTSMLKTSGSTESKTQSGEGGVGVGNSRVGQDIDGFDRSKIDDDEVDGGEVGDNEVVIKNCLSPKICLNRTFLPPELN